MRTSLFAAIAASTLIRPAFGGAAKIDICSVISIAVSSKTKMFRPGTPNYQQDIAHWASSSQQDSMCSVEPGTATDVGIILVTASLSKTPFAVKGGGHTSNPGFSSTPGVQIAMSRFSEVTYDAKKQTVVVGAGLVWDDVYAALAPHGVTVVGARVSGVGVAGFALGGGYSWKTNQYGLTLDTIVAYELVKTNGQVVQVTAQSDPDLFFALRGGMNNFGIVTRFTLKTFPQTQVWGGLLIVPGANFTELTAATNKFISTVKDPKASLITAYNYMPGQPVGSVLMFYDSPTPPAGIFDDFLALPIFTSDVKTRDYLSLIQSSPDITAGSRGAFNTVPIVDFSLPVVNAIVNETLFWGNKLTPNSGFFASYAVEPFLPTILTHSTSASAYPASRSTAYLPFNVYLAWTDPTQDAVFHEAIKATAAQLTTVAVANGQSAVGTAQAPLYPNYAVYGTPVERLYGTSLAKMRKVQKRVDPFGFMKLAGGFKI